MKCYMAGPITGADYKKTTEWREYARSIFIDHNIKGFSPMRGKAYLSNEEKIADSYSDFTMSSINGINVRDYNDCKTADAILVNFLDCNDRVSIGTVMEIAWARAFQIPIVIVIDKNNVHNHGMLTFGNIIVDNLDDGIRAVVQLLTP